MHVRYLALEVGCISNMSMRPVFRKVMQGVGSDLGWRLQLRSELGQLSLELPQVVLGRFVLLGSAHFQLDLRNPVAGQQADIT